MAKKIGIVFKCKFEYYEALNAVKAKGGTQDDKKAIFAEYLKIRGIFLEVPEKLLESHYKVDGFVIEEKELGKMVEEAEAFIKEIAETEARRGETKEERATREEKAEEVAKKPKKKVVKKVAKKGKKKK